MAFSFLPTLMVDELTDVTVSMLNQQGIRLLMLDFDNTIVPYTTNEPTPAMERWLKAMTSGEVPVCVVSNSKNDRVKIFCRKYGIDCITHAKKPFHKGINECLEKYGRKPEECALAGDQIFTDTLGGRSAGLKTILVKPIDNHNFWLKARHVLEKPFIYLARNRRITK